MPGNWYEASVSQGFGPTNEPLDGPYGGYEHFNKGLDFAVPLGTPITATVGGKVIAAGPGNDGWGTRVWVQDANGNIHNYGHLQGVDVKVGQTIAAGTPIGKSGNTGKSTGPHLSYDVWNPKGEYIDPSGYLPKFSGQQVGQQAAAAAAVGPDGRTFAQITGTQYRSVAERDWYWQQQGKAAPAMGRDLTNGGTTTPPKPTGPSIFDDATSDGAPTIRTNAQGQAYAWDRTQMDWVRDPRWDKPGADTSSAPTIRVAANGQAFEWNGSDWVRNSLFDSPEKAAKPQGAVTEQQLRDAGATFGAANATAKARDGTEFRRNADGTYDVTKTPSEKQVRPTSTAEALLGVRNVQTRGSLANTGEAGFTGAGRGTPTTVDRWEIISDPRTGRTWIEDKQTGQRMTVGSVEEGQTWLAARRQQYGAETAQLNLDANGAAVGGGGLGEVQLGSGTAPLVPQAEAQFVGAMYGGEGGFALPNGSAAASLPITSNGIAEGGSLTPTGFSAAGPMFQGAMFDSAGTPTSVGYGMDSAAIIRAAGGTPSGDRIKDAQAAMAIQNARTAQSGVLESITGRMPTAGQVQSTLFDPAMEARKQLATTSTLAGSGFSPGDIEKAGQQAFNSSPVVYAAGGFDTMLTGPTMATFTDLSTGQPKGNVVAAEAGMPERVTFTPQFNSSPMQPATVATPVVRDLRNDVFSSPEDFNKATGGGLASLLGPRAARLFASMAA